MPLNNASQAAVLRDGRRRMPGVNPKNLQFFGDSLNSTFVENGHRHPVIFKDWIVQCKCHILIRLYIEDYALGSELYHRFLPPICPRSRVRLYSFIFATIPSAQHCHVGKNRILQHVA